MNTESLLTEMDALLDQLVYHDEVITELEELAKHPTPAASEAAQRQLRKARLMVPQETEWDHLKSRDPFNLKGF
ncbi:hypothetical protein ACMXYX_17855 (plasmid) [Neptuniibacter sp. QD72_48]|uniref:hypothetical protein n=1 Tax=Neptuniibacter sp. QD72_48 TaxID=3398214 RepID=UPI0039F4B5D6